jgi:hypothetical protein
VKPVVAFGQDNGKVVTIPAGGLVKRVGIVAGLGLQSAWWDGHPIMAYEQDLAANSQLARSAKPLTSPT